ncbi:MAG: ATP-dependent zinc metalloprotease FtsH [Candidatus Uhrbacteria bacterium]
MAIRSPKKHSITLIVVFIVIAGLFSLYNVPMERPERVGINEFVQRVREGSVQRIEIQGSKLTLTMTGDAKAIVQKEPNVSVPELLESYGLAPEVYANIALEVRDESGAAYWAATILPFLLPLLIIGGLVFFMMRQVQGANSRAMMFGQARVRDAKDDERTKTTFRDVAGVREAKEELEEIIEFLKLPKKFAALGAKIPRGVLLMGQPGTGKTLLARAIAGEANVPFLHISASEFVEMFVGVGASRVRSLFQRAKKIAPCIVFIDEIDAVGRQRGTGLGGGHDEREQTLNQILVEMDGFSTNNGVIVVAATNRPDVLDPALLRPGRFDRRIVLDMPDIKDREEILKVHSVGKPIIKNVSIRKIAERTPGFSGADLANLMNEAALLTARRNKHRISMAEFVEAIEKVMLGPARKSRVFSKHERELTAYHEAGHALIAQVLPNADPVRKVSIISRGMAGGYTLKLPTEDKHYRTRAEFLDDLAVMLGGYAAERTIFGDGELSTGPSSDLRQATHLARRMITEFGMSDVLGPRTFGQREELVFLGKDITAQRDYSEHVAEQIDSEMHAIINTALERAQAIINEQRDYLDRIAALLLKNETIEQAEFESIFAGEAPTNTPEPTEVIGTPEIAEKDQEDTDDETSET